MKTRNIILTEQDNTVVSGKAPHLKKRFAQPYNAKFGDTLSLQNLYLYYSWRNITDKFQNTGGCSYVWTDGVEYPVPYDAGSYNIAELNEYLRAKMRNNNHYLVDENGVEQFYLEFVVNPVYYRVTLTSKPVPSALPAGWTNPNDASNVNGLAPQLRILPTNKWGELIGFSAGYYPATLQGSQQMINGSLVPQISPITTVNVVVDQWITPDEFSTRPNVIASFTPAVNRGELIDFRPPVLLNYEINTNQYKDITVSFLDNNFDPIELIDTANLQLTLLLTTV